MAKDYVMPKLAMAMNEGTITEWLVEEGTYVEKGAIISTIETEKVAYDLEAPESGYLHIVLPMGETADCGTLIGQFAESEDELASLQAARTDAGVVTVQDEMPAASDTAAAPSPSQAAPGEPVSPDTVLPAGGRIIASPLARKMAADENLDLAFVQGTGPGGRIVKRDILAAVEQGIGRAVPAAPQGGWIEKARIPFSGTRRTIAARLTESLQSTAQLSSFWESDITDLLAMRRKFVEREDALGTRVSVNAFLIKAVVYGIRRVPIANARLVDDDIVIYDNINMGFAVSLPGQTNYDTSLLVPVLHNVENLGVVEIDLRMKALVARVREGRFTEGDLAGSTITLSTTAGIAPPGHRSTPVLNLPNAMLVGPSTPIDKPAVVNGHVVPRTMLPVSATFDHRVLDGDPAVRFMNAVHDALENPELLMS
ncbi:MAG: 2-oxo acid dehydrogenase [Thiotrichales bacterium SG8_50]|nr:MAG: 2-oxo acid dehydrogenase [Thiotrichales bacterium SG8_50]